MWVAVTLGAIVAGVAVEAIARLSLLFHDRQFSRPTSSDALRGRRPAVLDRNVVSFNENGAIWREMHDRAKASQRKYLLWNARSVALLAIALVALFATLVLFEQPPSWLKALAVLLDLAAFALALRWRRRAICEQAIWIVARSGAELLRHSRHLRMLVPSDDVSALVDVLRVAATEAAFHQREIDISALLANLERLQQGRVKRNRVAVGAGSTLSRQRWLEYLELWPAKQQIWFTASYDRLREQRHVRESWLRFTFWTGAAIAVVKLLLLLSSASHEAVCSGCVTASSVFSFALVCVTTLSASMLAYHANRNARSLFHIYALQLQRLREWVLHVDVAGIGAGIVDPEFPEAQARLASNFAIDLDSIMFDELLAWMHVTGYDAVELAA